MEHRQSKAMLGSVCDFFAFSSAFLTVFTWLSMNHCFVGSEGIMWCGGIHIPEQIACMPVLHNVVHYHAGDSLLTEDLLGQVNNCFAGAAVLRYLPDKGIF